MRNIKKKLKKWFPSFSNLHIIEKSFEWIILHPFNPNAFTWYNDKKKLTSQTKKSMKIGNQINLPIKENNSVPWRSIRIGHSRTFLRIPTQYQFNKYIIILYHFCWAWYCNKTDKSRMCLIYAMCVCFIIFVDGSFLFVPFPLL